MGPWDRNPDLRQRTVGLKAWRHNADQRSQFAIHRVFLAKNLWIPVKAALPGLVIHYKDGRCARLSISGSNTTSQKRRYSIKLKSVGGDSRVLKLIGLSTITDQHDRT